MMRIGVAGIVGAAGLAALAVVPEPAEAQGVRNRIDRQAKNCPPGWSSDKDFCVANSGSSPAIYHIPRNGQCAEGYDAWASRWCVEDKSYARRKSSGSASVSSAPAAGAGAGVPQSAGLVLAKSNPQQLCPSGYRTTGNAQHCITIYENAPAARARPAGGCALGELEELGAWCTSRQTGLTWQQIESMTMQDVNIIYTVTKQRPFPERDVTTTPLMVELRGTAAPQSASNAPAGTAQTAAADAVDKPACKKSKKGQAARALGGLLGKKGAAAEVAGAVLDCAD